LAGQLEEGETRENEKKEKRKEKKNNIKNLNFFKIIYVNAIRRVISTSMLDG